MSSSSSLFVRAPVPLTIVAKYLPDPIELDNYVDNFISQAATEVEARAELHKLTSFCKDIGLDLHEVFCAQRYKFLSWIIDTVRWLVIIPDARFVLVLEILHGDSQLGADRQVCILQRTSHVARDSRCVVATPDGSLDAALPQHVHQARINVTKQLSKRFPSSIRPIRQVTCDMEIGDTVEMEDKGMMRYG
eukprot:g35611.t1